MPAAHTSPFVPPLPPGELAAALGYESTGPQMKNFFFVGTQICKALWQILQATDTETSNKMLIKCFLCKTLIRAGLQGTNFELVRFDVQGPLRTGAQSGPYYPQWS